MNKVILVGVIGNVNPTRIMQDGRKVTSFSLATVNRYTTANGERKEITQWHNVSVFGNLVDTVEKHFVKGQRLAVDGELTYSEREHNVDGVNKKIVYASIRLEKFDFAGPKPQNQGQPNYQNQVPQQNQVPVHNQAPQPNYQNQAPQQNNAPQQNQAPQGQNGGFDDFDDEIPF